MLDRTRTDKTERMFKMPLGVVRQLDISSSFPPAPVGHLKLHPFAIFSAPFDTAATCLPSVKLQIQAHSPRYSPHHRKDLQRTKMSFYLHLYPLVLVTGIIIATISTAFDTARSIYIYTYIHTYIHTYHRCTYKQYLHTYNIHMYTQYIQSTIHSYIHANVYKVSAHIH